MDRSAQTPIVLVSVRGIAVNVVVEDTDPGFSARAQLNRHSYFGGHVLWQLWSSCALCTARSGAFDRTPVVIDRFCSRDSKSVASKGRQNIFKYTLPEQNPVLNSGITAHDER